MSSYMYSRTQSHATASKDCVGAMLAQQCAHGKYKGHLRPVAFMSRK